MCESLHALSSRAYPCSEAWGQQPRDRSSPFPEFIWEAISWLPQDAGCTLATALGLLLSPQDAAALGAPGAWQSLTFLSSTKPKAPPTVSGSLSVSVHHVPLGASDWATATAFLADVFCCDLEEEKADHF